MERLLVSCPNCGGTFEVPKGVSAVKCPYCGYTITFLNQTVLGMPVYMNAIRVKKGEALEKFIEEMAKQAGVDEGFLDKVRKAEVRLVLIPFMVFDSKSRAVFYSGGRQGDVAYEGEVIVPLNEKVATLFSDIPLPPVARIPMDANLLEEALVVPMDFNVKAFRPEVKEEEVELFFGLIKKKRVIIDTGKGYNPKKVAEKIVKEKLRELLLGRGITNAEYRIRVEPAAVVYAPFYWFIYGDGVRIEEKLHGFMDASSGEVIIGFYKERETAKMKNIAATVISLLSGITAGAVVGNFLIPILIAILMAIPLGYRSILKAQPFGRKTGITDVGNLYGVVVKYLEGVRKGE